MKRLPLNLYYLKYFCDAVRQGSISAAARDNYVSQSAISQAIAQLEKSLGKELITHQTNRFKATPEGLLVYDSAKPVFNSITDLEHSLSDQEVTVSGQITFACTHSFALALLPKCLKKAKTEWPQLRVNFRLAHTDVIKSLLKKGHIDFGIVLDNEDLSGFDCHELCCGEHRLYISKKLREQKNLPFLVSEERLETNLLKASYRKRYRKEMPVLMEVSSWEVIANLTEEGIGIGFFPDYVAARRKSALVEYVSKCESIPYRICAILPKAAKMPRNRELFLKLLSKEL
ncbi:MAG: LysR family transcriptional regulator [Parachlamydia sp.]|nr:LysR family transcriptional regulator [Parachlamydia sp.]